MRRRAEALREGSIGEDAHERRGESTVVGPRDQEPLDAIVDEVEQSPGGRHDHPSPARERLDHDEAEALRPGRQDEQRRPVEGGRHLGRTQPAVVLDAVRMVAQQRIDDVLPAALADDHEPGVREVLCDRAPGRGEPVDVLVGLEHADEERGGSLGQRSDRVLDERGKVAVRLERRRGRLAAYLLDQTRGERRHCPGRVGSAEGRGRYGVRRQRQQPSPFLHHSPL